MSTSFLLFEADNYLLDNAAGVRELNASFSPEMRDPVRRPLRGTEISEDTYATIQIFRAAGSGGGIPSGMRDSSVNSATGTGISYAYSNFVLQQVTETRQEKMQIVETFGEDYAFFFGEKPTVVNVSGRLVNTPDFNWRSEWWYNYENSFRGTQLVTNGARLYLTYETVILEGYLISSTVGQSAQDPRAPGLQFSMWVTARRDVSEIGAVDFPTRGTVPSDLDTAREDAASAQYFGDDEATPRALAVRQANIAAMGGKPQSLTEALNTAFDAVMTGLEFISQGLDYVKNVMMGKSVRIPRGYLGSELMTQRQDLASGTFTPGQTITGLSKRMTLQTGTTTPGNLDVFRRTKPLRGKIWEDNWDEYLEGGNVDGASSADLSKWEDAVFVASEKARTEEEAAALLELQARKAFSAYSLDPDIFVEDDLLLLGRAAFGTAMALASTVTALEKMTDPEYMRIEAHNRDSYYDQKLLNEGFDPDPLSRL